MKGFRAFLLFLLYAIGFSTTVLSTDGPANGDLQLCDNKNGCRKNASEGVLHIFIAAELGTVSYKGFTFSAANTSCKQMGFVGAVNFTSTDLSRNDSSKLYPNQFEENDSSGMTPVLLKDVDCTANDIHILRCNKTYITQQPQDVIGVYLHCNTTRLVEMPFIGQLNLFNGSYHSQGLMQIYLNDMWGTICIDKFNQSVGDSACRQMGYTGARNISTHTFGTGLIWLKDFHCNETQQCFKSCYTPPTVRDISCRHIQDVFLMCEFIEDDSTRLTGGDSNICQIQIVVVPVWVTGVLFAIFFTIAMGYIIIIVVRSFAAIYHNTSAYRSKDSTSRVT